MAIKNDPPTIEAQWLFFLIYFGQGLMTYMWLKSHIYKYYITETFVFLLNFLERHNFFYNLHFVVLLLLSIAIVKVYSLILQQWRENIVHTHTHYFYKYNTSFKFHCETHSLLMIQGNYKSEHAMCSGWNCCYSKRGLTSKVCQISQLLGVNNKQNGRETRK